MKLIGKYYVTCFVVIFGFGSSLVAMENFSILDKINHVCNYVVDIVSPDHTLNNAQKLDLAMKALDVSPYDISSKLIFAFFLDHFVPSEDEKDQFEHVSKLEYFAGSITARAFELELKDFLDSNYSEGLASNTRLGITRYLDLIIRGHNQNTSVDALRSRKPLLSMLAKTGLAGLGSFDYSQSFDIDNLIDHSVTDLRNLEIGEGQMFLAGTPVHDTWVLFVHSGPNEWQVTIYDSRLSTISFDGVSNHGVYQKEFWKALYFAKIGSSNEGFFSECFQERKKAFSGFGKQVENMLIRMVNLGPQKRNTCHFRGLHAGLKDQIFRRADLIPEEARIEWKKYKMIFGKFLLSRFMFNDLIFQKACLSMQNRREESLGFFLNNVVITIPEEEFKQVQKAYECVFRLLGYGYRVNLNNLELYYYQLQGALLDGPSFSLDSLREIKKTAHNIYITNSIDRILKLRSSHREKLLKSGLVKLEQEIQGGASLFDEIIDMAKSCLISIESTIAGYPGARRYWSPAMLKFEDNHLRHYLQRLEQNPESLFPIKKKTYLSEIINQSWRRGMLKELNLLVSNLSCKQVDELYESISKSYGHQRKARQEQVLVDEIRSNIFEANNEI